MASKKKYSDILAEVLERKHSKCICPTSYLEGLRVKGFPKDFNTGECQFGPNCEFSSNCQYNKAACTCYPKCTCDLAPELCQPLTVASDLNEKCSQPNCICVGTCFCQSEDSFLLKSSYLPPSHCDKNKCICSICLCQPEELPKSYLPSYFRNNIKKAAGYKFMTDDEVKQECAEIKQLLDEHEESQKKETPKPPPVIEKEPKKKLKKTVSIFKDMLPKKKSLTSHQDSDRKSDEIIDPEKDVPFSAKTQNHTSKSILKILSAEETQSGTTKKEDKSQKKDKSTKTKTAKFSPSTKKITPRTIARSQYTRRSTVKRKPMRIRYYYSGSTENYGVKLGHKNCVIQQSLVPKHMGWLWNIEDHSKGIRERKGWPPGFIGKSIKNMIKVMKQFEEHDVSVEKQQKENQQRWISPEYQEVQGDEPKEEPPLLHIHKKGRTYNITFCPKNSDDDIGPVPIPFTITEKKRDSDSESSESTLEFELHSPKPRLKSNIPQLVQKVESQPPPIQAPSGISIVEDPTPPVPKAPNKRKTKKKSMGSEENKILWEEQLTQIQKNA